MTQPKIKKVSVFSVANPEHAIASLRLVAPLSEAGIDVIWRMPDQEYDQGSLIDSDLVIIQRDYPRFVDQYIRVHSDAHRFGIPVVFEIDDLLWELPEDHPDRLSHHYTEALIPMMFTALAADALTVATPGIKDYLIWLNPNIFVLPNYLNPKFWRINKPVSPSRDTTIIGYMGGESHQPDLEMIETALVNILDRNHGNVKFKVWGLEPPQRLIEHPLVEWSPLTPGDYQGFADFFSQQIFDIYILPLQDSLFNRAKSSIKFLEFTSMGISGVSSDIETYRHVVTPEVSGMVADSINQWESHLEFLIANEDKRVEMAARAQETLQNNWLLSDHYLIWKQAYESIISSYKQREDVPRILQMMRSIMTQSGDQTEQLRIEIDDKQTQLELLTQSGRWQVRQAFRKFLAGILPDRNNKIDQEKHGK